MLQRGSIRGPERRIVYAVLLLAGVLLLLVRRPTAVVHPYVWGEDGTVFWAQALVPGSDWLTPYAAQWWLTQRLLAWMAVHLPVTMTPTLMYLTSCVIAVGAVSVVLQRRALVHFRRFRFQALAYLVALLVPVAAEVQGNWTNVQVWLAVGLLVILTVPAPARWWGKSAELAFVTLTGLTAFLGVIMAPVALWALLRDSGRYVRARSALLLSAAVVNLLVWAGSNRPPAAGLEERLLTIPAGLVKRLGGGAVMGQYPIRVLWTDSALSIFLIPSALFLALLGYLVWRDRRGPSPIWLAAGVLWGVLGIVSPTGALGPQWVFAPDGWRYFVLAVIVCYWILVRALSDPSTRGLAGVGLLICVPAMLVGAYLRPVQPPVDRAQLEAFERCLDTTGPCRLDIAPQGWQMQVP